MGAHAIGYDSNAALYGFASGHSSRASSYCVSIGNNAKAQETTAITIGSQFADTSGSYTCTTEGTGSITIGAGANTLNNGDTESSNSVTIGCKASNQGADSVVIGASASGARQSSVTIGAASETKADRAIALGNLAKAEKAQCTALGYFSNANGSSSTAIGARANVIGYYATALGLGANAIGYYSTAIGTYAKTADYGATVFRSTAEDGTYTQLYFSGANTPLANTYENGEAMMGYVVRDKNNNIMTDTEGNAMVGTQKLSVLFPNNRGENAFTPAMLGLDDEWTPKPMFRPSDLDLPQEEPTEPEEYQPLPVYPIVEPEIEDINSINAE